ncbi:P-loop containing nucleoside triphosphate hydrolase protein [Clavulina sp. PMI_390]|nr:P-loop containing nucleoside triphosphate hydrolase protein [Clavulina sp. PMI_390]
MSMTDIEKSGAGHVLEWTNLTAVASNGNVMLHPQSGSVHSGSLLAVMGPSGAGKSTFLDLVSRRRHSSNTDGVVTFDGSADFNMRDIANYVEQDDALLGVLTVRETVTYAAKLSLPSSTPSSEINQIVDETLRSMGLSEVADNRIGNPIQRGISGGQKRRVTMASAVVSRPRILLCDEPTSGLDSLTSMKVISSIKAFAKLTDTIVIATIHQPNWETFSLFDEVLFLAGGHAMYQGPINNVVAYFDNLGFPCPGHTNPADHVISVVNTDFVSPMDTPAVSGADKMAAGASRTEALAAAWQSHQGQGPQGFALTRAWWRTYLLMQRMAINYQRNLLAYGVRVGMYAGMGFLLATVWVHLGKEDTKINDRLSVHFFSVAFLGFMSVAGIPSFLEERAVFMRERNNGLYGPGAYVIANSLVNIPFLFMCATLFVVICYWAIGLHPGVNQFFRFLSFLFIAIYTAEAQAVFVAAALPIFVAALAIASFLNGLWMCVQGYFIRAINLPRFWYYTFHWIDYQTYAFNLLARSDLTGVVFTCQQIGDTCQCAYPSSLTPAQCAVRGEDVLQSLQIDGFDMGLYAGILIIIAVVYRILFWAVLVWRKK